MQTARVMGCSLLALLGTGATVARDSPAIPWAEILVTDEATGRGVPLVELVTVNNLVFVTDNAGRVAFHEPGLMGETVFFHVRSHGHALAKDGFGHAGARVTPRSGEVSEIRIRRTNIAERWCRLTGEGRYRDSWLLGHPVPGETPAARGRVAGQDSIQAVPHRERIHWFWGDTSRMEYPLGLFRMAGATSPLPGAEDDLSRGIAYEYFVDASTGFARAMMPIPERPEGVVWLGSVFVVPDEEGAARLVGHYSRRKGLDGEIEQGIAVYDDARDIFEPALELPLTETWRRPAGHPIPHEVDGTSWIYFGSPNPNVRVRARLRDVLDPTTYEAFDGDAWNRQGPPLDSKTEHRKLRDGALEPDEARFCPVNAEDPAERVLLHSGTVRWNPRRQRWILIAGQSFGKPSALGEVWYAEAREPTGPFARAVRIVTHDRQTFYNVCHHDFLDRDGGRHVYFEGTYTHTFSGNSWQTPRYDYNQILYRLDLEDPRLQAARVP